MTINVLIEIPQDGGVKYELDKTTNRITVDRFLHTAMRFPFNYGYVPETLAEDNDPIDVLVVASQAVVPGSVLPAEPIGLLEMEDEAGNDAKIIAVPTKKIDPFYGQVTDIDQLNQSLKAKIKHFFEHYKELEPGKWVKLNQWQNKTAAEKAIETAKKNYKK